MKKTVFGIIIGMFLSTSIAYAAVELKVVSNPFPVYINGIQTEVDAYNINGYTYLKLADMSKAGLEVKFNETQRRIEVLSAILISNAPEGVDKVSGVVYNEYGLPDLDTVPANAKTRETMETGRKIPGGALEESMDKFVIYNGVKYIRIYTFSGSSAVPRPDIYRFVCKKDRDRVILSLQEKDLVTGEFTVILTNIPYTKNGVEPHIPYDYYLNTIVPLMTIE